MSLNKEDVTRLTWEEYFLELTKLTAKRSTCIRKHVGAVIVRDNVILSTGYNGAPSKCKHCIDIGCIREKLKIPAGKNVELCRGGHAETNAIALAAKNGVSINNAELYTIWFPCSSCMKSIITSGIKKVYYEKEYDDNLAKELASESGIIMERL